jgi:hypothetical protein
MLCYVSKWFRVVYLRSVSCAQCCVMLISGVRVFYLRSVLCFVCLRPVSCVPNVASVSGLSILDFFFGFL